MRANRRRENAKGALKVADYHDWKPVEALLGEGAPGIGSWIRRKGDVIALASATNDMAKETRDKLEQSLAPEVIEAGKLRLAELRKTVGPKAAD